MRKVLSAAEKAKVRAYEDGCKEVITGLASLSTDWARTEPERVQELSARLSRIRPDASFDPAPAGD